MEFSAVHCQKSVSGRLALAAPKPWEGLDPAGSILQIVQGFLMFLAGTSQPSLHFHMLSPSVVYGCHSTSTLSYFCTAAQCYPTASFYPRDWSFSATTAILKVNCQINNNKKPQTQPNMFVRYLYSEQENIFFITQKKSWTLISPGIIIFQSQFQ